ncbi:MAG: hypothetical protein R2794_08105 [Chitinophagales bacterium]
MRLRLTHTLKSSIYHGAVPKTVTKTIELCTRRDNYLLTVFTVVSIAPLPNNTIEREIYA